MNKRQKEKKRRGQILALCLVAAAFLSSCQLLEETLVNFHTGFQASATAITVTSFAEVPAYSGEPYVLLGDGTPAFTQEDLTGTAFETYSELDELGRCSVAYANICPELMPTEERSSIGQVKPSGWQSTRYDCVDGKYLYNRCHLIGYQLSGENANKKNLITGTRYLNVEGMLPFEDQVADYVKETGNHVLYRVRPIFEGSELVARGVQMEALSVEDGGDGIMFNVFAYNVQPGVVIDYATGESYAEDGTSDTAGQKEEENQQTEPENQQTYILNIKAKKFHNTGCASAASTKEENKETFIGNREELIAQGYKPCGQCKP